MVSINVPGPARLADPRTHASAARRDDFLEQLAEEVLLAPFKRIGLLRKIPNLTTPEAFGEGFQGIENETGDGFQRMPPVWFVIIDEHQLAPGPDPGQQHVDRPVFVLVG